MIFSRSSAPALLLRCRGLILVALMFSACPGSAEITPATDTISPAVAGQTAEFAVPPSSVSSAATPIPETAAKEPVAAERVKPFYENSNTAPTALKQPPKIGSGSHLLNVTLGLAAIIGLIFVLSAFVKRFGAGTFATNSQLKILSSLPLGTRERIVLIDAGGQQLLLGITPTSINTLHVFTEPVVIDNKSEVQSDFSQKLMAILQQKGVRPSSNNKNDSATKG
jgi:flagellar protein FliO/FliZ